MQDKGAGVPLYEFEGKTKSKMTKPYVKGKVRGPILALAQDLWACS